MRADRLRARGRELSLDDRAWTAIVERLPMDEPFEDRLRDGLRAALSG